jgi:DNA repair photolyase
MTLIKPFDPWKSKICTCSQKFSLSAYTGCSHGCLYCYASSYIVNFSNPRPKRDFVTRLGKEIRKIPANSHITIANSSDPYFSLEKDLCLTRQALEILSNCDIRVSLVTKSNLILRDIDILKNMKKVIACISLTTIDEKLAKKLEPNAPPVKERLEAVKILSEHIPVAVRLDPLIYPLNLDSVKETISAIKESGAKQIITSTYKTKPDNFKRMINAFSGHKELWEKLYLRNGEKRGGYIYLSQKIRKELIEHVRSITLNQKMQFSSCREGFESLNTASCDGSF